MLKFPIQHTMQAAPSRALPAVAGAAPPAALPAIGRFTLRNRVIVAPMAGVTDRPFRKLCKKLGAGYAVSEMVASRPELWQTPKSMRRRDHAGEVDPIAVQIAGADPQMMAEAARFNVEKGAQIIDINMGCPAKKVCNVAAGSALLKDEALVQRILCAVVNAVKDSGTPVTLKTRTGWSTDHRNALTIARIAQDAGIAALTLHGRTRACGYAGHAEYETIAAVKRAVSIPVFANGDINSPQKAKAVLEQTNADAVMIGRAAQGRPWIFREIEHLLTTGTELAPPRVAQVREWLLEHLEEHYSLYGEITGVRTARKHIGWYVKALPGGDDFRDHMNTLQTSREQVMAVAHFFDTLRGSHEYLVSTNSRDATIELEQAEV
jgi:tRNA-dihydrouridine synthase B